MHTLNCVKRLSKHNFTVANTNFGYDYYIAEIYFNRRSHYCHYTISLEGCHRQLYKKKRIGRWIGKRIVFTVSAFSWQLNFIGRLFPARQWPPLFLSFSIRFQALFLSRGFSSRRIPSKNKQVPPAWFLQPWEKSAREKGTFVVVIVVVVVVLIRAMQPSRHQSARDCKETRKTRYRETCKKNLIGEDPPCSYCCLCMYTYVYIHI